MVRARDRRKVIQIGNSLGITLSPQILEMSHIEKGVEVDIRLEGDEIIITRANAPETAELPDGISREFIQRLNRVIDEHRDVLEELSKH